MPSVSQASSNNKNINDLSDRFRELCPLLWSLLQTQGHGLLRVVDESCLANCGNGDTSKAYNNNNNNNENNETIPYYWHVVHWMLILRVLVVRTSAALASATLGVLPEKAATTTTKSHNMSPSEETPQILAQRLQLFTEWLPIVEAKLRNMEQQHPSLLPDGNKDDATLAAGVEPNIQEHTTDKNQPHHADRVAIVMGQLMKAYRMQPFEVRVLQFLVTTQIQPCPSILDMVLARDNAAAHTFSSTEGPLWLPHSGGDDNMAHASTVIRYVCGVTALQWSNDLTNEDSDLCKDRVLLCVDEDYAETKLAVSPEVCHALMGWKLESEDYLKLAGTKLLALLQPPEQGNTNRNKNNSSNDETVATTTISTTTKTDSAQPASVDDASVADIIGKLAVSGPMSGRNINGSQEDNTEEELYELLANNLLQDTTAAAPTGGKHETDAQSNEEEEEETDDPSKPAPFENELDYLHQFFEIVMHKVIYSRQQVAKDLRNASLAAKKDTPSWMRDPLENSSKQRSVGEIAAKLRLARRKMELSLECNRKQGTFYPRLELLAEQLRLDDFEKFVLVYLVGSMISPIFKSCINGEDKYRNNEVTVGNLLVAYFETFASQVSGRKYFYKTSTLLRKGLIRFFNDYSIPSDLTDQGVKLDRRVLDCIVGLDKESSEVSHGSHLYDPKVSLDSVVLPAKLKETLTGAVSHFEKFRSYRKQHPDFDEAIAYGVGLTLMFCGKSGTGKTMTANAIAAKLEKKVLLVNYPLLQQKSSKESGSDASKFQSIFREAELSDAIVFFDECESLFSKRTNGGSADITELLTELERFEGIVFLATNRPYDLDEAMYRRISEVFEFQPPNFLERLEIWKLVTSHNTIPCDPGIDWEAIALQYELTGGFIKNAVISALLDAVGRDPRNPQIVQSDILNGCKKQVRGALQMVDFNERVIPKDGLNDLVVSDSVMSKLREIVNLEKARGILFGSWGFDDAMRARQATTALFWGPSGTGRSRSAEAIGFELGKPLKVVDLPRLLSETKGSISPHGDHGAKTARSIFHEARLMDAVLVLDGFALDVEHENGGSGGSASYDARLLNIVVREMARFPGVVILMVDTVGTLDVFVSRLDKSLVKSLKFMVEFQLPTSSSRQLLWEKLMPPALPIDFRKPLDYKQLAEASHGFNVSHIGNVIYRAAASAALQPNPEDRRVGMKDLLAAIQEEKTRGQSAVDRWVSAQYV